MSPILVHLLIAAGCGRPTLEVDPTGTVPAGTGGTTATATTATVSTTGTGATGTVSTGTTGTTGTRTTGTGPTGTATTGTGTRTGTTGTSPANHPPEAPVVVIQPTAPVAGDDLACVIDEPSIDRDGDPVTYHYAWEVDGLPSGIETDVVDGAFTAAGETWTCIATPDDGKDLGEPGSASVVVGAGCTSLDTSAGHAETDAEPALEVGRDAAAAWTVEAWVYLPSWWTHDMVLLWKGEEGVDPSYASTDYGLAIERSRAALVWVTGDDGPGCGVLEGTAPWAGAWTHVAATLEATSATTGTKRLFVNGLEVASCTYTDKAAASAGPLVVGAALDAGGSPVDGWDGLVDELRISSVARYDADFTPAGVLAADADTVALWHFDEGSGSTAFDAGAAGLDLHLQGADWSTQSTCDLP